MAESFAYTPVKPSALGKALTEALSAMGQAGDHYIQAATLCTLIILEQGYDLRDVEHLVATLAEVHPNRTFLIVLDDHAAELRAEYSTRCEVLGPKEHVCSEIIRLTVAPSRLAAACSVVRANLLTGRANEQFLYVLPSYPGALEAVAQMADQVMFSSALFEQDFSQVARLQQLPMPLVDLEWVKLGVWRDQIWEVFEHIGWQARIGRVTGIEIEASSASTSALPASVLLMVGWLMAKLQLTLKSGKGAHFEFEDRRLEPVPLSVNLSTGRGGCGLDAVRISLQRDSLQGSIELTRGEQLEAVVTLGEEYGFSKPFEGEARADLIKRYYFIGESLLNYPISLDNALRLSRGAE